MMKQELALPVTHWRGADVQKMGLTLLIIVYCFMK